ncbi:IS630 family transposase, partial [Fibrella aquatilis]
LVQLDDTTRQHLRQLQRTEAAKRDYVKITTILLLDQGFEPDQIEQMLGIDHTTVYRYAQSFRALGSVNYLGEAYRGWWGQLDSSQLAQLQAELRRGFFTSAAMVANWIHQQWGIRFHPQAVVKLLNRLGFSYKKTTLVSSKADPSQQTRFVAELEQHMAQLPADEVVYFADAVHPQHNTRPAYGWIERGVVRAVDCNCCRYRLNINAVLNAQDPCDVVSWEGKTINSASTIELLAKLLAHRSAARVIHVYCDSARYYVSKEVRAWLLDKPIVLHHLPTYSPNLNLIERLWKFMRQKVIDSTWYPTLGAFRSGVLGFLSQLGEHRAVLERLM